MDFDGHDSHYAAPYRQNRNQRGGKRVHCQHGARECKVNMMAMAEADGPCDYGSAPVLESDCLRKVFLFVVEREHLKMHCLGTGAERGVSRRRALRGER